MIVKADMNIRSIGPISETKMVSILYKNHVLEGIYIGIFHTNRRCPIVNSS